MSSAVHHKSVILPDLNLIIVDFFGTFEIGYFLYQFKELRDDPSFSEEYNIILDLTGCKIKETKVTLEGLAKDFEETRTAGSPIKQAYIVDSLLNHGLVRKYLANATRQNVEYNLFDASENSSLFKMREWLEIPSDHKLPLIDN